MFSAEFFTVLLAILGSVLLGIFTFSRNFRSQTHIFFLLFTLTTSIYNLINFFALQEPNPQIALFWIRIVMMVAILMNIFFYYLACSFPKTELQISRRTFYISLLLTFVLLPFTQTSLLFESAEAYAKNPVPGPLMAGFLLHTLIFLGGGFLKIVQNLRRSKGIEKRQVQLFFVATVFMFSAILLTNLLLVVIFSNVSFVGLLPIYTLIFVAIISYAILKYKLLDIGLLVARSVVFSLTVAVFSAAYGLFLFLGAQYFLVEDFSGEGVMLSVVLALILAISFQPMYRTLAHFSNRVFFKGYYDPNKLLFEVNVIMAATLYLEDVVHLVLQKILFEMKIRDGAFILSEEGRVYLVASEGNWKNVVLDEMKLHMLLEHTGIVDINSVRNDKIKTVMQRLEIEVAVPMYQEGKHLGWLVLGPKLSGEVYNTADFRVLEILAPEIAVAIQNAKSYEEIRRFSITLEDEVDHATKKLLVANEKLKELDKLKDEFVSVASHELRTPMTAIKSYLWMALQGKGGDLTDKQKYYLERAYNSTDRLIKLVNEMLNISRIESGRIALQVQKVELFSVLQEVIAEVQPRADEQKIEIKLKKRTPDGKREIHVLIDVDKIKEVLINLIGNSLKFTHEKGKVTLSIEVNKQMVKVFVQDNGVGIEPEYIPSLFQKFGLIEGSYQTNQASSQGTGLGLYISKSIVELHGGEIGVESEGKGKGALFFFTIPLFSEKKAQEFAEKFSDSSDAGIIRNSV